MKDIFILIFLLIKQLFLEVLVKVTDLLCKLLGIKQRYEYSIGIDQGKDEGNHYVVIRRDTETGVMEVIDEGKQPKIVKI